MREEPLNRLSNWVYKIARIGEVLIWFCAVAVPMLAGFLLVNRDRLGELEKSGWHFNFSGVTEQAIMRNGAINVFALVAFMVTAVVVCALTALMLHRLCTVVKRVGNGTPFRRDVIEPIRQIGHLCIAIPIVEFLGTLIASLGTRANTVTDVTGVFVGLVVLWVTRAFIRGVELEDDVEGLL